MSVDSNVVCVYICVCEREIESSSKSIYYNVLVTHVQLHTYI